MTSLRFPSHPLFFLYLLSSSSSQRYTTPHTFVVIGDHKQRAPWKSGSKTMMTIASSSSSSSSCSSVCRQHHAAFVSSSSKNARVASSVFSSTSKSSSGRRRRTMFRTTTTTTTRANGAGDVAREIVEDIKRKIEENKNEIQRREEMKYQSPPGVPRPPVVPVIEPGKFGFVENAEIMNSRASMIGWWSLLFVELVAGKGLLEMLGFTVGKGINFTF